MAPVVLWCGDFGGAVAAELARSGWSARNLAEASMVPQAVRGAGVVAFATWRERRDITRALDEECWDQGTPWLCAVAEHPWVRVGPAITPARTPCYDCFLARRRQHDGTRDLTAALEAAYLADPLLGVQGYLPHHAVIAAGLIQLTADDPPTSAGWRAPVRRYHTVRNELVMDHVVGVHNCPRCDMNRAARDNSAVTACLGNGSHVA